MPWSRRSGADISIKGYKGRGKVLNQIFWYFWSPTQKLARTLAILGKNKVQQGFGLKEVKSFLSCEKATLI